MNTIVLDTLDYTIKLETGGFTEVDVVEKWLATQRQVSDHQSNLRRDIE